MITQKPAHSRLPRRVASTAFAALLLLGLPLAAQRSAHGGGGGGGGSHSSGGGSHSPGSSGGGGRSAHGVPGGGSHGGFGGHGGFNGHGGGRGYWRGGHFYYYPAFWGWGFWPSFSWWWYDDPYYYDGYYGGPRYNDRSDMGALDLDVSPGRTHVFVNGEDLGEVDRYDGWPGYLWLPRGTYDIAFYLDGYKTIARQISIYPGTVIDIDDRMEKGQSIRPEDLPSKSHERRDERIQYERERSDRIDRQSGDDDDQDWHERIRQDRGNRGYDRGDDRRDRGGDRADGSQGHLRLSVEPDDASVYLDGQFVGTGTDLSLLRRGLALSPGTHRLAVVRPGHKAVEKEFTVKEGEDVRLEIALESGSR